MKQVLFFMFIFTIIDTCIQASQPKTNQYAHKHMGQTTKQKINQPKKDPKQTRVDQLQAHLKDAQDRHTKALIKANEDLRDSKISTKNFNAHVAKFGHTPSEEYNTLKAQKDKTTNDSIQSSKAVRDIEQEIKEISADLEDAKKDLEKKI